MKRLVPGPGQESVWDYPRPPRVEAVTDRIRVVFGGETIVDTTNAVRVLETSHPPTYYVPLDDIRPGAVVRTGHSSFCEYKGRAVYYNVIAGGKEETHAAWGYPSPSPGFEAMRDHVAFYASRMDACYVGDELVTPQPGNFYGGWITSKVVGPFKGGPGTWAW